MRAERIDPLGSQHQAPRHLGAKHFNQIRAHHGRHESELHLAQAEEGILGGDRDITASDQADTAAHRCALNAGYGRLGHRMQEPKHLDKAASVG